MHGEDEGCEGCALVFHAMPPHSRLQDDENHCMGSVGFTIPTATGIWPLLRPVSISNSVKMTAGSIDIYEFFSDALGIDRAKLCAMMAGRHTETRESTSRKG